MEDLIFGELSITSGSNAEGSGQ